MQLRALCAYNRKDFSANLEEVQDIQSKEDSIEGPKKILIGTNLSQKMKEHDKEKANFKISVTCNLTFLKTILRGTQR